MTVMGALKMRQDFDEFELKLRERAEQERLRREQVLRQTQLRARQREIERVHRHGTARFVVLVLTLIATAVLVTVVMFRTLYVVMG
jgi:hypothetical protein